LPEFDMGNRSAMSAACAAEACAGGYITFRCAFVATVSSELPPAIDPELRARLRLFVADEPADVVPCAVFMFDEPIPMVPVPLDMVPWLLSPDCAEPLVPPDVPPLVAPEPDPDPVAPDPVEPDPAEPDPVAPDPVEPELAPVPALPALPPVCASASPMSATAAMVASEVTIFVDISIS
jgi:hypothetical protein